MFQVPVRGGEVQGIKGDDASRESNHRLERHRKWISVLRCILDSSIPCQLSLCSDVSCMSMSFFNYYLFWNCYRSSEVLRAGLRSNPQARRSDNPHDPRLLRSHDVDRDLRAKKGQQRAGHLRRRLWQRGRGQRRNVQRRLRRRPRWWNVYQQRQEQTSDEPVSWGFGWPRRQINCHPTRWLISWTNEWFIQRTKTFVQFPLSSYQATLFFHSWGEKTT